MPEGVTPLKTFRAFVDERYSLFQPGTLVDLDMKMLADAFVEWVDEIAAPAAERASHPLVMAYPSPLREALEKAGPGGIVYVDENMTPVAPPQKTISAERAWQIEQCKKHGYWKSLEYLMRHD